MHQVLDTVIRGVLKNKIFTANDKGTPDKSPFSRPPRVSPKPRKSGREQEIYLEQRNLQQAI